VAGVGRADHRAMTAAAARGVLAAYAAAGVAVLLERAPVNRAMARAAPPALAPAPTASREPDTAALAAGAGTLAELRAVVEGYRGLAIARTATRPVFADGAAGAALMVVGEAPGAEEDRAGVPFVGPAGRLLDAILRAIGRDRARDAYITNVVHWRPPGNRDPTGDEVAACAPILRRHVELAGPRVILAAGRVAARALTGADGPISRLRGAWHAGPGGVPVRVTYAPAYLLRTPTQKAAAWADALAVLAKLREGG
jgi:uracil-DNA glycosylase